MKMLLISFIATAFGCVTAPQKLEGDKLHEYMQIAAKVTDRKISATTPLPDVYLVNDFKTFYHMTCRDRSVLCGIGVAGAVYVPGERLIIVNASVVKAEDIDSILVHEFVHHLQNIQHDRRSCFDHEFEAYTAQARYHWMFGDQSIYDKIGSSCAMAAI